jgi:hypothetical protein
MAYDFVRASSQYLSTASTPVDNEPMTFAAFFNSKSATDDQGILSVASGTKTFNMRARGDAAGDPLSAIKDGSGFTVTDTTTGYSTNTWEHGIAVFASSTSRTIYLNAGSNVTNTGSNTTTAGTYIILIGALLTTILRTFSGSLAEVGIWSSTLTPGERAALSKGFSPRRIRPQSIVFYAPLIRDLQDLRGGRAITNNNSATVAVHPRVY